MILRHRSPKPRPQILKPSMSCMSNRFQPNPQIMGDQKRALTQTLCASGTR